MLLFTRNYDIISYTDLKEIKKKWYNYKNQSKSNGRIVSPDHFSVFILKDLDYLEYLYFVVNKY